MSNISTMREMYKIILIRVSLCEEYFIFENILCHAINFNSIYIYIYLGLYPLGCISYKTKHIFFGINESEYTLLVSEFLFF